MPSPLIATFNLRHFKPEDLTPWKIAAVHPQEVLNSLFESHPATVRLKMREQADDRKRSLADHLRRLRKSVPEFVDLLEP